MKIPAPVHIPGVTILPIIGKTLVEISNNLCGIMFYASDGSVYYMYHEQDCCEKVDIEQIDGDLEDLLGSPIIMAEEFTSSGGERREDYTDYTFYKFATVNGYVTIRWSGTSNGYYSTAVTFKLMMPYDPQR